MPADKPPGDARTDEAAELDPAVDTRAANTGDNAMVCEKSMVAEVAALVRRLDAVRPFNIGFPGAVDFDYGALAGLFARQLLNNVGDPLVDGAGHNHTKAMEREVVAFCADLFRAPVGDFWGYVTSGGSEGNLYGLYLARSLHPGGIVYHSDAAHPSMDKAIDLLGLASVRIRADQWGQLDYHDLTRQVEARRDRAVIVAATIGTTMTEAVDDVRRIHRVLDAMAVRRRFIHADAALSGIPLALLDPGMRPGFDFADGADAITISGHKFLGAPEPCGVVVVKASHRARIARAVGYTASPDTTIGGSRSGHAPLVLWAAIRRHGVDGLRQRAEHSRALAGWAHERLTELGWPAFRHEHAFTVVLQTPPEAIAKKWVLATGGRWSHLITMPGITIAQINHFIGDLAASLGGADAVTGNRHVPVPRTGQPDVPAPV